MSTAIKTHLVKLAAYYEKNLSDEQIMIYSNQITENLTDDECAWACKLYISDPKNEFFPKPVSKLIALIRTPLSSEDVSQNITSLLLQAERKYGIHWSEGYFQGGETIYQGKDISYKTWRAAAISVFGETGLKLVDRYGGWKEFCINVYDSPDGVVRAQVAKAITSLQNTIQKTGDYDALPQGNGGAKVIQLMQNFKTIEGEK